MVVSVNGNIIEQVAFKNMGFSRVREKKKDNNEILMRKSACSNFTSNDYFLDCTSLNSFVFAGMCLRGVHVRTANDALQDTALIVLEKKCGPGFYCLPG